MEDTIASTTDFRLFFPAFCKDPIKCLKEKNCRLSACFGETISVCLVAQYRNRDAQNPELVSRWRVRICELQTSLRRASAVSAAPLETASFQSHTFYIDDMPDDTSPQCSRQKPNAFVNCDVIGDNDPAGEEDMHFHHRQHSSLSCSGHDGGSNQLQKGLRKSGDLKSKLNHLSSNGHDSGMSTWPRRRKGKTPEIVHENGFLKPNDGCNDEESKYVDQDKADDLVSSKTFMFAYAIWHHMLKNIITLTFINQLILKILSCKPVNLPLMSGFKNEEHDLTLSVDAFQLGIHLKLIFIC